MKPHGCFPGSSPILLEPLEFSQNKLLAEVLNLMQQEFALRFTEAWKRRGVAREGP